MHHSSIQMCIASEKPITLIVYGAAAAAVVLSDAWPTHPHYTSSMHFHCAGLIEKYLNVYVPAEEAVILFTASL